MDNRPSAIIHSVFALIFAAVMAFCIWFGMAYIKDTKERYKSYEQVEAVVLESNYHYGGRRANYYEVTFGYIFNGKVYTCEKKCIQDEPHNKGDHTFGYCDSENPNHFCLSISYGFGIGMIIGSLFFGILAFGSILEHLMSDDKERAKAYHRMLNAAESLVIGIAVAAWGDFHSYTFIPLVIASAVFLTFMAIGVKILSDEKNKYGNY